jgi:uncharacterized OsmC-like protein
MSLVEIKHVEGRSFETLIRNHRLRIDLPEEMHGKNTGPTPPELFAASLASCIGFYVLFYCEKKHLSPEGLKVDASFHKYINPDRIGKISVRIQLPSLVTDEDKEGALKEAERCIIHNTLCHKPEVKITLE